MIDMTQFRGYGNNVTLHEPIVIIHPESILFSNNIIVDSFSCLNGGNGLYLGNNVDMSLYTTIIGSGYCIIEDFATLAAPVAGSSTAPKISRG